MLAISPRPKELKQHFTIRKFTIIVLSHSVAQWMAVFVGLSEISKMDYQEIQQMMNSTNSGDPLTSFLMLLQLSDEPLVKTSQLASAVLWD